MPTISVCIVNYNTRELLHACLDSVLKENPDEVIVVDNASSDNSVAMVEAEYPSIRLVKLNKNIGYGAASNRAIEQCHTDHILLLNSDTLLKPGSLDALNRYLVRHEFASIVGPRVLNPDGTIQTSCFYFPTPVHIFLYLSNLYKLIPHLRILRRQTLQAVSADRPRVVPWVLGAALAFRRATFETEGGFDEDFFMYFEEVDLCYRLSRNDQQVRFVPEAEIIHVGGASTAQLQVEMQMQYFSSLVLFYRKHYSRLKLIELMLVVNGIALLKYVRDLLCLPFVRDVLKRSGLRQDLTVQQGLLSGRWNRRIRPGEAFLPGEAIP